MARSLAVEAQSYKHVIRIMKQNNKRYDDLAAQINNGAIEQKSLAEYIQILKDNLNVLKEQRGLYKDAMLTTLEKAVKDSLALVAPAKQYEVKLVPAVFRNKNILRLRLVDTKGRLLPPKIIEGDMLNQVLSFATIAFVSYQLGYSWLYYDEAFPSANVRSLVLIRELIRTLTEMGMRFVFVTQNPIVLASLDHHVVELIAKDNYVSNVIEYDIDGDQFDNESDVVLIDMLDAITKGEMYSVKSDSDDGIQSTISGEWNSVNNSGRSDRFSSEDELSVKNDAGRVSS